MISTKNGNLEIHRVPEQQKNLAVGNDERNLCAGVLFEIVRTVISLKSTQVAILYPVFGHDREKYRFLPGKNNTYLLGNEPHVH